MDGVAPHHGDKTAAYADHLSKLRRLRKGWRTLNWKNKTSIPVEGSCNSYELVDGYFVKVDIHGNILVIELPSTTEDGRTVCNENLEMIPGDFALDPTQDVIVFLKPDDGYVSTLLSTLLFADINAIKDSFHLQKAKLHPFTSVPYRLVRSTHQRLGQCYLSMSHRALFGEIPSIGY